MTIRGQSPDSLLDSVLQAASTREQMDVEVLAKAQGITRQQGAAMVQMLEQAAVPTDDHHLDTYA